MFKSKYKYAYGTIFLIVLRAVLNAYVPLMDKTEARYAEIARIMQETNNWVTPQIDYNIPFWAKPPLSTWLSALSINVFGVNEFAVRLPYLLASIFIIFIASKFVKSPKTTFLCAFILLTIPEFLLHAGVVSTDTFLCLCVTMVFLSFWQTLNSEKVNSWTYLFYIFLGLGLLAKGPIILILTLPPIFIWAIYFKKLKTYLKKTTLISGTLLTLVIAVPWYYLAEIKTKGFLEYFILGEHFKRFFDSGGWDGDKYGFAKTQPIGIIWVFLFLFAFPWIQILAIKLWRNKKTLLKDKWVVFLLLWMLWTPLFFTFSKSLIHTYILPSMVPIALMISYYWETMKNKKVIISLSLIFPIFVVISAGISLFNNNLEYYAKTDKYLLDNHNLSNCKIYYLNKKTYSSQFYSKGKIESMPFSALNHKKLSQEPFAIIIKNRDFDKIDNSIIEKLEIIDSNVSSKIYLNK